jgi:hypothetical protein
MKRSPEFYTLHFDLIFYVDYEYCFIFEKIKIVLLFKYILPFTALFKTKVWQEAKEQAKLSSLGLFSELKEVCLRGKEILTNKNYAFKHFSKWCVFKANSTDSMIF